ncbi:cyclic lactone autoinducer peptide [Lutispora sp.]|nr:cyclic lactone autoinducer peptide [Lutispora sp.]MEA4960381.1 cyclic lactone autoinducer peptide [Lutispora sp.]
MKKVLIKLGGVIASLALMVTTMNVNTTCIWLIHQPKLPKGAEKLRKFK